MRVIFRDFGRRKLHTAHDRDFQKQRTLSHGGPSVHPFYYFEMDPSSPASSSRSMNFPLSSLLSACYFWLSENNFLKAQPQQTVNLAYCAHFREWHSDVPLFQHVVAKRYNKSIATTFLISNPLYKLDSREILEEKFNPHRLFPVCYNSCNEVFKTSTSAFHTFSYG